jgi:hypothetical protein
MNRASTAVANQPDRPHEGDPFADDGTCLLRYRRGESGSSLAVVPHRGSAPDNCSRSQATAIRFLGQLDPNPSNS